MRAQVGGDRRALRKSALAHRTFERFFSTVCSQVGRQVGCLSKSLLADGTLVRFFSIVRPEMRLERRLPCVRLAADMAGIVARERVPHDAAHGRTARETSDGRRRARGVVHRAVGLLGVRRRIEGAGYVQRRRVGVHGGTGVVARVTRFLRT